MKKYVYIFAALLIIVSCGNDDDYPEPDNKIEDNKYGTIDGKEPYLRLVSYSYNPFAEFGLTTIQVRSNTKWSIEKDWSNTIDVTISTIFDLQGDKSVHISYRNAKVGGFAKLYFIYKNQYGNSKRETFTIKRNF